MNIPSPCDKCKHSYIYWEPFALEIIAGGGSLVGYECQLKHDLCKDNSHCKDFTIGSDHEQLS